MCQLIPLCAWCEQYVSHHVPRCMVITLPVAQSKCQNNAGHRTSTALRADRREDTMAWN